VKVSFIVLESRSHTCWGDGPDRFVDLGELIGRLVEQARALPRLHTTVHPGHRQALGLGQPAQPFAGVSSGQDERADRHGEGLGRPSDVQRFAAGAFDHRGRTVDRADGERREPQVSVQ
jgi:hypothetical protein